MSMSGNAIIVLTTLVCFHSNPALGGDTKDLLTKSSSNYGSPQTTDNDDSLQNFVLPVQLMDFSGTNTGSVIALKWEVSPVYNSRYFEVQRSLYTVDFKTITKIDAFNGLAVFNYDDSATAERSVSFYYRIKMVDTAGNIFYSPVINITFQSNPNAETTVAVYPNPVKEMVTVSMNVSSPKRIIIEIENPGGQNIYHKELNEFSGFNAQEIDLRNQSWGIYLVSVDDGVNKYVKKVVVR